MKTQILAGTLGLVLLLSLVPLQPAEAKTFLIDDFSNDPSPQGTNSGQCDIGPTSSGLPFVFVDFVQTASLIRLGVLGDWRICNFLIDVTSGSTTAGILVSADTEDAVPFDMFRHEAGANVQTMVELTYNGTDGTAASDAVSLDLDFTSSDDVQIMYSVSDENVNVKVRLTDTDGDWAELNTVLVKDTVVITSILLPIVDFGTAPDQFAGVQPINLNHIAEVSFFFDTTTGLTDYVIEKLDITMAMVGGEMFPVDTTALLLAGVELNAIWILPAIAAIGIGAFIVSRKRN